MLRCKVMVPFGKDARGQQACWEPLNDNQICPVHGQQGANPVKDTSMQTLVPEPGPQRDKVLPLAYIASPYSHKDPAVRQQRYEQICEITKQLALKGGYAVYSPIAHWHPICMANPGMPTDAAFWKAQNEGIIGASQCVIVAKMDGWRDSIGVEMEIRFANRNKIKLVYLEVPLEEL